MGKRVKALTEKAPDQEGIRKEFRKRQTRQIAAIAAALFLVLLGAVLHKRPDLVGAVSRQAIFSLQAIVIAAFLGFTAMNWRCPSCGKHLGGDIHRQRCRKCGARLQ
jgi:hypothetical protein